MEIKQCIDKMHALQDRMQTEKKSLGEQRKSVTGRVVTDLEMNGVYRGAVEQSYLARSLRQGDALNAECIHTFASEIVDTSAFFNRLDLSLNVIEIAPYSAYVPPTKQPRLRNARYKPQSVDMYGFRPLADTPFALLCVYEFLMFFHAGAVLSPWGPNGDVRAQLAAEGNRKIQAFEAARQLGQAPQRPNLMPVVDFVAREPLAKEYFTFPTEPLEVFRKFRHSLVILRRR